MQVLNVIAAGAVQSSVMSVGSDGKLAVAINGIVFVFVVVAHSLLSETSPLFRLQAPFKLISKSWVNKGGHLLLHHRTSMFPHNLMGFRPLVILGELWSGECRTCAKTTTARTRIGTRSPENINARSAGIGFTTTSSSVDNATSALATAAAGTGSKKELAQNTPLELGSRDVYKSMR
jgi:hypothetical protein